MTHSAPLVLNVVLVSAGVLVFGMVSTTTLISRLSSSDPGRSCPAWSPCSAIGDPSDTFSYESPHATGLNSENPAVRDEPPADNFRSAFVRLRMRHRRSSCCRE